MSSYIKNFTDMTQKKNKVAGTQKIAIAEELIVL